MDPLKPLTAQHQHTDSGNHYGNLAVHENGHEADSTKQRKRSNFEEALLQSTKKLRCSSAGPSGVLHPPHNALQASRFGPSNPRARRTSLDGTPMACCSEPACPTNALHGPPRVPPNGFWAPARQPTYTAPMGPELLSWVLMVPPAAATLSKPAWANAPAAPAAAEAAPPAAAQQDSAAAQQQEGGDVTKVTDASSQPQPAAAVLEQVDEQATSVQANSMEVDIPITQQVQQQQPAEQQQQQQQGDVEMASAPQEGPLAEPSAPGIVDTTAAAAAEVPAAPAGPAPGPVEHSLEVVAPHGSAVEVRIVLDGCVFVGQLKEVSRLEMGRSRVGAAVEPIKQVRWHKAAASTSGWLSEGEGVERRCY